MNLLITWCRTWRRSEPRWAAGRREGRVHRSCKAAAPRTESQTLSPRGSEDGENKGMRPDCSTRRLNSNDTHTHSEQMCVCEVSPGREREPLCPGGPEPSPAAPGTERPAPAEPSGPWGWRSPAQSWSSSCSAPAGSLSSSACENTIGLWISEGRSSGWCFRCKWIHNLI